VVSGNGRGYPEEKVYSPGAPRSWSGRRQSSNGGPSCKSAANVELKGKARQLEMVQFDRTLTSILNSRFYLKEHPCRVQRGVRVFYPKRRQHCTVGRSTSTEENARERECVASFRPRPTDARSPLHGCAPLRGPVTRPGVVAHDAPPPWWPASYTRTTVLLLSLASCSHALLSSPAQRAFFVKPAAR
jgi:hypothetical protein